MSVLDNDMSTFSKMVFLLVSSSSAKLFSLGCEKKHQLMFWQGWQCMKNHFENVMVLLSDVTILATVMDLKVITLNWLQLQYIVLHIKIYSIDVPRAIEFG